MRYRRSAARGAKIPAVDRDEGARIVLSPGFRATGQVREEYMRGRAPGRRRADEQYRQARQQPQ